MIYEKIGGLHFFFGGRIQVGPHWHFTIVLYVFAALCSFFFIYLASRMPKETPQKVVTLTVLINLFCLLKGSLGNPGISQSTIKHVRENRNDLKIRPVRLPDGSTYCTKCNEQNLEHCYDCDICMEGNPHHCVFFGKCVKTFYFYSTAVLLIVNFLEVLIFYYISFSY